MSIYLSLDLNSLTFVMRLLSTVQLIQKQFLKFHHLHFHKAMRQSKRPQTKITHLKANNSRPCATIEMLLKCWIQKKMYVNPYLNLIHLINRIFKKREASFPAIAQKFLDIQQQVLQLKLEKCVHKLLNACIQYFSNAIQQVIGVTFNPAYKPSRWWPITYTSTTNGILG